MVAAALALALGLAPVPGRCRQDYDALRYRDAAQDCQAELPRVARPQLAETYKLLGMSLAIIGERESAKAAFVSLLSLEPNATLPDTVAPKLRDILDEARREGAAQRVSLTVAPLAPADDQGQWRLSASVSDGPLRPVRRIIARAGAEEDSQARRDGPVVLTLSRSSDSPVRADVLALDRFGGPLATADLKLEPARTSRPAWLSWEVWGASSLALGAVGLGLGYLALNQEQNARSVSSVTEARRLDASARGFATGANVLYGVAAGLAVGAVVLLATGHSHE